VALSEILSVLLTAGWLLQLILRLRFLPVRPSLELLSRERRPPLEELFREINLASLISFLNREAPPLEELFLEIRPSLE
jgi:hypothetical protein